MKTNTSRRIELRHYDSYNGGGCRVYEGGQIVSGVTATGCGYDRAGTALANWVMEQPELMERLQHLTANYGSGDTRTGYYGLSYWNYKTHKRQKRYSTGCRVRLDGGCGMSSIKRILQAIRCEVLWCANSKNSDFYIISWLSKE